MNIDFGTSLPVWFTTLASPYLNGLMLDSTLLGKVVERVRAPIYRQLFLGLGIFAILFFVPCIPQISDIVDGLMKKYDMEVSLGNKTMAYIFIVGIATYFVSFAFLIVQYPFNRWLNRRNDSDERQKPLFQT